MTTANPRASLLAGLRTGGVRSTSSSIPHTAAPGGSFNINPPRFVSNSQYISFPEEEDADDIGDMPQSHHMFTGPASRQIPMTAAVDGPNNRFSQHQQMTGSRGMNPHSAPFNPAVNHNIQAPSPYVQSQALQMQLMQLEIMRLQTIQAQQYQSELLAQAQRQQQSRDRRASVQFNPPATVGPLVSAFDLRAATLSAQTRKASQADQLKAQLGVTNDDQVPMTAGLGGKFGSRMPSLSVNGAKFGSENDDDVVPQNLPATSNQSTTVISGGISLGNPASNVNGNGSGNSSGNTTPSKSDSAVSWRRGGNNNSVLSGSRAASSSPNVRITPPPGERGPPHTTTAATAPKLRPQPLRFNIAASQPMVEAVAIEIDTPSSAADTSDEASSTGSFKSLGSVSSPTTPHSPSSSDMPLSPREEAAKKLYEGLGIGRPVPVVATSAVSHRMASQPLRQPRGPPSGADELGPKNFATRIRRKAIGGLGALMAGRERRELVDAF